MVCPGAARRNGAAQGLATAPLPLLGILGAERARSGTRRGAEVRADLAVGLRIQKARVPIERRQHAA